MPKGPLNIPRPIATSSINLKFYGNGIRPSEVVLETQLRKSAVEDAIDPLSRVDVTVNEGHAPDSYVITLVTHEDLIPMDEIEKIWDAVEKETGDSYSSQDVEVHST